MAFFANGNELDKRSRATVLQLDGVLEFTGDNSGHVNRHSATASFALNFCRYSLAALSRDFYCATEPVVVSLEVA